MDCDETVEHFWNLAVASFDTSPELSKYAIMTCLEALREAGKPVPEHFKKMMCMKCMLLFVQGSNCKVLIQSNKKRPNLKIIEYHCLSCGNVQRVNVLRNKQTAPPPPAPVEQHSIPEKKMQQRRKLMMDLFS